MIVRGYKVSSLTSTNSSAPAQVAEVVEEDVEEAWVLPDDAVEHPDDVFDDIASNQASASDVDMAEEEGVEVEANNSVAPDFNNSFSEEDIDMERVGGVGRRKLPQRRDIVEASPSAPVTPVR